MFLGGWALASLTDCIHVRTSYHNNICFVLEVSRCYFHIPTLSLPVAGSLITVSCSDCVPMDQEATSVYTATRDFNLMGGPCIMYTSEYSRLQQNLHNLQPKHLYNNVYINVCILLKKSVSTYTILYVHTTYNTTLYDCLGNTDSNNY